MFEFIELPELRLDDGGVEESDDVDDIARRRFGLTSVGIELGAPEAVDGRCGALTIVSVELDGPEEVDGRSPIMFGASKRGEEGAKDLDVDVDGLESDSRRALDAFDDEKYVENTLEPETGLRLLLLVGRCCFCSE